MKKLVLIFFLFTVHCSLFTAYVRAETAEQAYEAAHDCYVELRSNANAQKLREPWEKCIAQFEQVKKKYSRQPQGAEAQYSLGRLFEELAANSKNPADWNRAVKEYETFARGFPRNKMADDAYFAAATIQWERLHDGPAAKKDLLKVIKHYKDGDKAGAASKYLKELEAGKVPDETAPKPPLKAHPKEKAEASVTIVIDPGHGGTDTGALGPDGYPEKDIALAISKKVAGELKEKLPGAKVFLTRDDDKTLTLDQRVRFANKKHADYFVSIHANASKYKKESGVQTYYLNNATDEASERLASQENKNAGRKVSDLDKIIATMIQTESTEESRDLAASVHKSLVSSLSKKYSGINDQKVRSALFYVLVGVKCPSILVETSYISNPKEEKRLRTDKYQELIADAISGGLAQHTKKRTTKTL